MARVFAGVVGRRKEKGEKGGSERSTPICYNITVSVSLLPEASSRVVIGVISRWQAGPSTRRGGEDGARGIEGGGGELLSLSLSLGPLASRNETKRNERRRK